MMRRGKLGYLFIAPATFHLVVFAIFPMVFSIFLSFYKWNLLTSERSFNGLSNYVYAFKDPLFWNALWNSTKYAALSVPLGMIAGLAVALLVNQKLRGVTIFRTLFYIPAISSGVAISILWIYIYMPETGLINSVLGMLHINNKTDFLKNESLAMFALVFMSIWVGLGPKMVLFLSGLIGIPPSLYEAAELDGAGKFRSFWSVTLPMLIPTTFFVLITSTIGALQVFTPVYIMTQGGPNEKTDVVGYHIYVEAWSKFLIGIASAKSFVLLLVIVLVSILQFRILRNQLEGYSTT
ncbi:MAG: sugar ABC transporter permease [Fimbriimonas sp.]|nr:sugar ABC transporter permease [Fimbriimonas sp.]